MAELVRIHERFKFLGDPDLSLPKDVDVPISFYVALALSLTHRLRLSFPDTRSGDSTFLASITVGKWFDRKNPTYMLLILPDECILPAICSPHPRRTIPAGASSWDLEGAMPGGI